LGNTSNIEKEKIIKKGFKENSGITLIALVITIIVSLILAGVTVATLTGDNRTFIKSWTSKKCKWTSKFRGRSSISINRRSNWQIF